MSDLPITLSYQQKTQPDVRLQRVVLGGAILAIDAALLLMFRFVVAPMLSAASAPGTSQRFMAVMFAVSVYSLMSLCVPVATTLLAGGKMPRIQAGRIVGRRARQGAIAIGWGYFGARLAAGAFRIYVLHLQANNQWPGQNDWRVLFTQFFETASALTLLMLQAAAWIYFADLAARLRRGAYLTLATIAFAISAMVSAVIFVGKVEQMAGGWYPPEARTLLGWIGSDIALCVVHLAFWSIIAGMLQTEPRRPQTRG